jgi:cold shock CspA family protein
VFEGEDVGETPHKQVPTMSSNYSCKKASLGQKAQFVDKRDDPLEAAERLNTPDRKEAGPGELLAAVADEGHDEMGATVDGQQLDYGMNPRTDSRGNKHERDTDYDWTRSMEVGPERRFGETLAQQEQRLGRETEQARHSTVARAAAAADIDREGSSRVQCEARVTEYQRTTSDDVAVDVDDGASDPRAGMDAETLAKINESAVKLAAYFGTELSMGRPELSRMLARSVENGDDVMSAVTSARQALENIDGVAQPLSRVDPFQYKATVEVEVARLYENPSQNQYQSGFLKGEDGTRRKFVYWNNSKKCNGMPTLREGDRVRFEEIKVGEYRGQASLAIDNRTEITILERGDGSSHKRGSQSKSPTIAPWDTESEQHAWINQTNVTSPPS